MNAGREIDKAIDQIEGEIRMLKMRVAELADEQPATGAPESDGLHPVALLLAEAYRIGITRSEVSSSVVFDICQAWSKITGDKLLSPQSISEYGKR